MWKKLADILYRQFTLTKTVEEQDKRMGEMRRDIHDLQLAVQRLIFEIERVREQDRSEREKLALQLELALVRFEQRLPPAPKAE